MLKIKWIEFENMNTGLKIERVEFNDDITLLVGLSGVGKTQILKAIEYSFKLAINKNRSLKPYKVTICISINNDIYIWSYYIKTLESEDIVSDNEEKHYFSYEELTCNGEELIFHNEDELKIKGYKKVPTPKKDESLLSQYSEDKIFKNFTKNIKKVYPIEVEINIRGGLYVDEFNKFKVKIKEIFENDPNVDFKIFSHLPVLVKLYIVKEYYKDLYDKIFNGVTELFSEINDIDVIKDEEKDRYVLAIEVYGKEIKQDEISNGMLKTIHYIVELITMSRDSLVLIDEFENGLGVNCIDVLEEMLINERDDLQFIITSHHPKIINQISPKKWKIIDRNMSNVVNSDAENYGVGNSLHDAYYNLINRWEFEKKI